MTNYPASLAVPQSGIAMELLLALIGNLTKRPFVLSEDEGSSEGMEEAGRKSSRPVDRDDESW